MYNNIEDHATLNEGIKLGAMLLVNLIAANVNQIISLVFGVLSIAYLCWKWRQDYLKIKKEKQS